MLLCFPVTINRSLIYGLVLASSIIKSASSSTFFDTQTEFVKGLNIFGFLIGGILVGLGTKLSNGCTSGHGVCGLPRLSVRSIVAVCCFVSTGIAVSTLRYYVPFLNSTNELVDFQNNIYSQSDFMKYNYSLVIFGITTVIYIAYFIYTWKKSSYNNYNKSDLITGLSVGLIFGLGLCISGMIKRTKVINFLS